MADITERIVIPEVPRVLDGQELYVYIPKAAIFDLNIEKGTGDVLVQTIDTDHSFKVMTDGRAKVRSAPTENDDVVRKQELDTKLDKGLIPSQYLPSYVDDVVEYDSKSAFPATGETGKIYVDKSTNLTYRWSGSTYIQVGGGDLNIENGTGTGSLVQKRLKSDGVTWTTTKAYQGASTAFGGGTQAGMTFEEWKKDNPTGTQDDYNKSYSFAFAANEENKAIARSSAAFGRGNRTYNPGEFVCGSYAEEENRSPETVFLVGGGTTANDRHNAFEVRTNHSGTANYSKAYIGGKEVATQDYVNYNSVHKEGNSYVLYANESGGKSTVIPYRFQKNSIINPEYTLMFQPMVDGRLYTRYPIDEYHVATKGYVDGSVPVLTQSQVDLLF